MVAPAFTFSGMSLPEDRDPLGVWELDVPRAAAFAARTPTEDLVWRADLPAARSAAREVLQAGLARIAVREQQLNVAAQRLRYFDPVPAYREGARDPEAALLAATMALRSPAVALGARASEAPALETSPEAQAAYRDSIIQCETLLAQFRQLIQKIARMETRVGNRLVARSIVDWTGDVQTTWLAELTPADMQDHLDTVRLALASRCALLRLLVIVTSGALGLAIKAQVPGGQFLLLPAVYQYVCDVLKALEALPGGVPEGWQ